ncbi:MAG: hypothetical protein JWM87_689 [Candidatus Eremiobacteraeota bacterium]|nr:hypothetical protein [Candidatus Eremiobacteraeota bacterium]
MSAEFAEDFRAQITDSYEDLINDRADSLNIARVNGMSALAEWIRTELWGEVEGALDAGDPISIDLACARVGLAGLLLRDASRAFGAMLANAYDGPMEERDERIGAAMRLHAGPMRREDA